VLYHFSHTHPQYQKNLFSQQHLQELQDSPKIWSLWHIKFQYMCVDLFLVVLASALPFSLLMWTLSLLNPYIYSMFEFCSLILQTWHFSFSKIFFSFLDLCFFKILWKILLEFYWEYIRE
jgi:hypothetical protein